MKQRLGAILSIILFVPVWLLAYTFFHEGGHAIVALMYGGTIDRFVLGLNAGVSHHGASFSAFGQALHDAAGSLLPTVLGTAAIGLYRKSVKFIGYHICYIFAAVSLSASALVWVGIPIISLFTLPPPGDDVSKFLNATGLHPLLVASCALLLVGAFVFLAVKKGVFSKVNDLRAAVRGAVKLNRKRIIIGFAAVLMLLTVALVIYNALSAPVFSTSFKTENVLEEKSWECSFYIEESKSYSVMLGMKARGFITALHITDENGELAYQNLGEDFSFTMGIGFDRGWYTLSLTHLMDYAAVEDFLRSQDMEPENPQYYHDAFGRGNGDYSAKFSIKVR